jgi:DNA-binding CsgD family transcriptional regulator
VDDLRQTLAEARLRAVSEAGLLPVPLLRGSVAALGSALHVDAWCGMTLDPVTLLPTGGDHRDGLPLPRMPRLLEIEYAGEDPALLADLSRRPGGAVTLHEATDGRPEASARYRDVLAPSGLPHELRVVLRSAGRVWGALVLLRAGDARPFAPADVAFATRVGDLLGAGLRRGLVHAAARRGPTGPAVLVLRMDDGVTVEVATPDLAEWRALVPDAHELASGVPIAVLSAAAVARDSAAGVATARMRTRDGRWTTVHATRADAGTGRVVVVMEPTRPHEVLALLMDAHGLSPREQEVVPMVLRGLSNAEIAARLVVSPWTAQDHVRNVFRKLGVAGRPALAARLVFDHYLPMDAAGVEPGPDGTPLRA